MGRENQREAMLYQGSRMAEEHSSLPWLCSSWCLFLISVTVLLMPPLRQQHNPSSLLAVRLSDANLPLLSIFHGYMHSPRCTNTPASYSLKEYTDSGDALILWFLGCYTTPGISPAAYPQPPLEGSQNLPISPMSFRRQLWKCMKAPGKLGWKERKEKKNYLFIYLFEAEALNHAGQAATCRAGACGIWKWWVPSAAFSISVPRSDLKYLDYGKTMHWAQLPVPITFWRGTGRTRAGKLYKTVQKPYNCE